MSPEQTHHRSKTCANSRLKLSVCCCSQKHGAFVIQAALLKPNATITGLLNNSDHCALNPATVTPQVVAEQSQETRASSQCSVVSLVGLVLLKSPCEAEVGFHDLGRQPNRASVHL